MKGEISAMQLLKKTAMIFSVSLLLGIVFLCFISQKTDVAMIEKTGDTAIAPRTENEELPYENNHESSAAVPKTEPIQMDKKEISLGMGETYTPKTNVKADKWISDNEKTVKIKDGKITAKSEGTAYVTAIDSQGNKAKCKITVKKAPESVSLEKYTLTLGIGENYCLGAVLPENTASANRTFRSSDNSIIKMTDTNWEGSFQAIKTGTAYVTVRLYNGKEASCEITVKKAPSKIMISKPTLSLGIGETYKLSCGMPSDTGAAVRTFRSSDNNIIKMIKTDWTAEIKAVKEGTAWVTVRTYNGKEASCKITVKKAPESVILSQDDIELSVGQKYTLTSKVNDGAASSQLLYSCSDESIVKIKKTQWAGEFEAVSPGEAWITVTTYNGIESSCKVTVKEKKQQSNNNNQNISFSTDTGHVTAPDGTPWTPESENTIVYIDENMLRLTNNAAVLEVGENYEIEVNGTQSDVLTYTSADPDVAVVDENGIVTAVDAGNTNIIMKDENGNSNKLVIIVLGDKESNIYPDMENISELLNSVQLSPVKTNYEEIDNMVDTIFAEIIREDMTNAEKAQACYDYLVENCNYEYGGYKAITIDDYLNDEDEEIAEFSYCILKNKIGTCENFSAAFVVMMRRIGFEANVVYGQVAMSAGGYDGHYWTDIEINNKHYLFDPQVERNCLGEDNEILHYFFGMPPQYNYNMYQYLYMTHVHGFKRSE